ncbi:C45 family autoproteolytic acyltransferase/hydolase [Haladaptatus cibarius]|uniref:C45 family autoproteolytic acyltransferase/hydolase n=1 Tax=Haladaptatus cibarius TaxID=453847 RepID=UPI0006784A99|nr:C45 family peptidase [Haladaptatus cibarius]
MTNPVNSEHDESLERELAANYQCYSLTGSHHEIGVETAKRSESVIESGTKLTDEAREVAEESREITESVFPEAVEEFRGYADALDLTDDEWLWQFAPGVQGGCSAVAVETEDGFIIGRNYDFFYFESRRHLIHTNPDDGFAHVGTHEGLIGGRFDGLNEAGLFVEFNGAGEPDDSRVGMPFHLVVRYLLENCETATEARDTLCDLPLRESKSYLLADESSAFVVEAHPEETAVREPEDGVLVATNHFVHPAMQEYEPAWDNSVRRRETLRGLAEISEPTAKDVQTRLRDHEAPVCGHEDGLATFWSCIADPAAGRVSYALGAPCRNEYVWTISPGEE